MRNKLVDIDYKILERGYIEDIRICEDKMSIIRKCDYKPLNLEINQLYIIDGAPGLMTNSELHIKYGYNVDHKKGLTKVELREFEKKEEELRQVYIYKGHIPCDSEEDLILFGRALASDRQEIHHTSITKTHGVAGEIFYFFEVFKVNKKTFLFRQLTNGKIKTYDKMKIHKMYEEDREPDPVIEEKQETKIVEGNNDRLKGMKNVQMSLF